MSEPTHEKFGVGGVVVVLLWMVAMLGVVVLVGVSFDAPHAHEGGLGAALAALGVMAVTGVSMLAALIGAAFFWHPSLLKILLGGLGAALLIGGGLRLAARLAPEPSAPPPWVDDEYVEPATPEDALIAAIDGNQSELVGPLLEGGADPDACNDEDQCAVSLAVYRRAHDTLRALAAHGAHLNGPSGYEERWPLEIAVDEGDRDTVIVLLSLGAHLPHRDLTLDVEGRGAEAVADDLLARPAY